MSDLLFKAFAKVAVTCDCNVYQLKISLNGFVLTQLNAIEKNAIMHGKRRVITMSYIRIDGGCCE